MIKFNCVLRTGGDGYWSDVAKDVAVTNIYVQYINEEKDFGELCVQFDTSTWDIDEDGLIYTDSQFEEALFAKLQEAGLDTSDVGYSEQGMQGDDFVSFDVGEAFLKSFANIAIEEFNAAWNECNA